MARHYIGWDAVGCKYINVVGNLAKFGLYFFSTRIWNTQYVLTIFGIFFNSFVFLKTTFIKKGGIKKFFFYTNFVLEFCIVFEGFIFDIDSFLGFRTEKVEKEPYY